MKLYRGTTWSSKKFLNQRLNLTKREILPSCLDSCYPFSQPPWPLCGHSSAWPARVSYCTLSHVDSDNKASMVDVTGKPETVRKASALARIFLGEKVFELVKNNEMKKGDVLTVSKLAGIMGAKRTSELIPLCHNISLTKVDVELVLNAATFEVNITSNVTCSGKTGVEMEALTAVSVAALTVYDMCKSVTHDIVITDVKLLVKSGGKSNYITDIKYQ